MQTQSATLLAPAGAVICSGQLTGVVVGGLGLTGPLISPGPVVSPGVGRESPGVGQKLPTGQGEQLAPKVPEGHTHAETDVDPAGLVLLPGQLRHCDRLAACVTTSTTTISDTRDAVGGPVLYVPSGHSVQMVSPGTTNPWPAKHWHHSGPVAPSWLVCPGPHFLQGAVVPPCQVPEESRA